MVAFFAVASITLEVTCTVAAHRLALRRLRTRHTVRAAILLSIAKHATVFHSPIARRAFEITREILSRPNAHGIGVRWCGAWVATVTAAIGRTVAHAHGLDGRTLAMVTGLALHAADVIVAYGRAMIGWLWTSQASLTTTVRRIIRQAHIPNTVIVGQASEPAPIVFTGGRRMIRLRARLTAGPAGVHARVGQA